MSDQNTVLESIGELRQELKGEWSAGDAVLELLHRSQDLLGEYGEKLQNQSHEIAHRDELLADRDRQLVGLNSEFETAQGKVITLNTELAAAYKELDADDAMIARIEAAKAEAEAAVASLKESIAKVQAAKESAEANAQATAGEFSEFRDRTDAEYSRIVEEIRSLTKETSSEQDDLKAAAVAS
jgi:septal ring factor EnvC (AmiA/AmiB activator)